MSIPTRVAASILMVLAGTLSPASTRAEFKVAIWHDDDDLAQSACLASLREMAHQAGIPDMSIASEVGDRSAFGEVPKVALHLILSRDLHYRDGHAISLLSVPFAIHDAAHFQKFVDSDLERELKVVDWSNVGSGSPRPWLAVAYGGFFQLFSRDRAMTEPKHFVEQLIGGTPHARLYEGVKAKTFSLTYSRGMQQTAFSPHDITQMAERGNLMAAVEVPTLDARSSGVIRVAKFANLTFTAVNAVVIAVGRAEQFLDLPPALQTTITRWVRERHRPVAVPTSSLKNRHSTI